MVLGGLVALVVGVIAYVLRPVGRDRAREADATSSAETPVNPAAYDAVMRARYLSVRTTDADTQAAIALLERAIALDPGFARAYADLAAAYVTRLTFVTPEETGELEQKAFAAAEKALSLDANLAEAYLARGDLLWTYSHHFAHERAAQEFRRALNLNPKSDQAHRRLARVYVHVGFFEEALQHAATALAINPSNAQALNSRAQALLWMGKDEEALAILLSIPGPVLPELVEANTAFALLRLGRRKKRGSSCGRPYENTRTTRAALCRASRRCYWPSPSPQSTRVDRERRARGRRSILHITPRISPRPPGREWGVPRRPSSGCGKLPRPDSRAIRYLRAMPTWIRYARTRVSRRCSKTCRNIQRRFERRCSPTGVLSERAGRGFRLDVRGVRQGAQVQSRPDHRRHNRRPRSEGGFCRCRRQGRGRSNSIWPS